MSLDKSWIKAVVMNLAPEELKVMASVAAIHGDPNKFIQVERESEDSDEPSGR
jgi:hypothetical protein